MGRHWLIWTLSVLVLSTNWDAGAREKDDDAYLKQLETKLSVPTRRAPGPVNTSTSFLPDISVVLSASAGFFSHSDAIFQAGAHDLSQSGFALNAVELSLSKSVDPYFRAAVVASFGAFGVELEEAYAETLALPWGLKLRAGLFLSGFGRVAGQHGHSWNFADQALFVGKFFGAEGNRLIGGELTWLMTFLPWYVLVGVTLHMPDGGETNRSLYGESNLGIKAARDLGVTFFVKQFWALSNDVSLLIGFSSVFGPNPSGRRNRTAIYGVDLLLRYRPVSKGKGGFQLTLQSEWAIRQRQVPGRLRTDSGGYAELAVSFTKRWILASRVEHQDNLAEDYLDSDRAGSRQRYSMSLSFRPTEFSRIRLQGAFDHNRFAPHEKSGSVLLQLEVNFGVHPPHAY